ATLWDPPALTHLGISTSEFCYGREVPCFRLLLLPLCLCFCAHHSTRNPLYFYPPPCAKFAGECTHRFCHSRLGRGRSKMMVCDSAAFGCLPEVSQVVLLDIKSRRDSPLCCRGEL